MLEPATVLIDGERFDIAVASPLVFGRDDGAGIIGLDARDMGISSIAGCVEWQRESWWIVNCSRKRSLLLDWKSGGTPQQLPPGRRQAITVPQITVLVPGVLATHALEVTVPSAVLFPESQTKPTGTLVGLDEVPLSQRDRLALGALFIGYLESFPRHHPHPTTYQKAADLLGDPWTAASVRRQIDRIKERLRPAGWYFEGHHANAALANCLIVEGVIGQADLELVRAARRG